MPIKYVYKCKCMLYVVHYVITYIYKTCTVKVAIAQCILVTPTQLKHETWIEQVLRLRDSVTARRNNGKHSSEKLYFVAGANQREPALKHTHPYKHACM